MGKRIGKFNLAENRRKISMKKISFLLLIIAALLCLFSGCKKSELDKNIFLPIPKIPHDMEENRGGEADGVHAVEHTAVSINHFAPVFYAVVAFDGRHHQTA